MSADAVNPGDYRICSGGYSSDGGDVACEHGLVGPHRPVNLSDEAVDETRMSECSFCGATVDIPIGAPDNWDVECEDCESNYYAGVDVHL